MKSHVKAALERGYLGRTSIAENKQLRIFGSVHENTTALKTIMKRLFAALEERGCVTNLFIETDEQSLAYRTPELIRFCPDVVLNPIRWGQQLFGDTVFELANIPQAVYMTDAPWLFHMTKDMTQEEKSDAPPAGTLIFSPEEKYLDWCEGRWPASYRVLLPLAASYPRSAPVPIGEKRQEICFIGNVIPELGELPRTIVNRLINYMWELRGDDATGSDLLLFGYACSLDKHDGVGDIFTKALPHTLWGSVYRLACLEALEGLPLSIYGKGWEKLLTKGPLAKQPDIYKGWLEPEKALPDVMSKAAINLQLTSLPNWYSGNMRTYDAAGLGTCVLHDAKRDVIQQFDNRMCFFTSRKDLREQAETLLQSPVRQDAFGLAAQGTVNNGHLWSHRAGNVLHHIRNIFGSITPGVRS